MDSKVTLGFSFLATLILASCPAFGSEPSLTIQTPKKTVAFTRGELLKKAEEGQTLTVTDDPAYKGGKMVYTAIIPAWKLFEGLGIESDAIVQFKCLDGYSAPLTTERLLNSNEKNSVAYIAIEPPNKHWPTFKAGSKANPGPFYLIWKNPHLSKVGQEEWPYQLAGFQVKPPLKESFPKIFPDPKVAAKDNPVSRGFHVFVKNCFACHTMNKNGESQIGPDLNVPNNATEYMGEKYIKMLIRNPQNLRHWPQARMTSFTEAALPDSDISDLISYLRHMAQRKNAN